MTSYYLIAGEDSGDGLGSALMRELKIRDPRAQFYGVGGPLMQAEGMQSLFPYHELALLGFTEILPHLFNILSRVEQVAEDIRVKRPAVVLTIDCPGFNKRVVKKLRDAKVQGIRFVHYVAPTVWAYRPRRAQKFAKLFDELLVLLPFEPPYFEKHGLKTHFVGHPSAFIPGADGLMFRARHDIGADQPLLLMLPGSRRREIERHMPIFARAATLLAERVPNLALVVPVSARLMPGVASYFVDCPFRAVLTAEPTEKFEAFAAADVALVKSGTVSLEVASQATPQVVSYRVNPLSAAILRRIIKTPYVNLINIIQQQEVIPELLQENATPEKLAEALHALLRDPSAVLRQREEMGEALAKMRHESGKRPEELAAEIF